jgi:hypothetical protein
MATYAAGSIISQMDPMKKQRLTELRIIFNYTQAMFFSGFL